MKKKFLVIFLSRVLSVPKKMLQIVRNKIKKESRKLVLKKKKSYSNSKNVKKFPKNSKFLV